MALFNKKELNYDDVLEKLEKEGRKGFNAIHSALLGAAVGAGAGVAAAGTLAGVAGATSIAGLTTAASWIGVTAVAATPVGWVLGSAVGLGAAGAGVAAWWNQRSINAERARLMKVDILEKKRKSLEDCKVLEDDEKFKRAINLLRTAHLQNLISEEQGKQLLGWLKENKITPEYAIELIGQQCEAVEASINTENNGIKKHEDSQGKEDEKLNEAITVLLTARSKDLITEEQCKQLSKWLKDKRIQPEYVMSLLDQQEQTIENANNNYSASEFTSQNNSPERLNNNKVEISVGSQPLSEEDLHKQTVLNLKKAIAEQRVSSDEGMDMLGRLRAKSISCEQVIAFINKS